MVRCDETTRHHVREIKTKGDEVLREILRRLLEGHEDPGFSVIPGAPHEKLHGEKCFAGTRTAADQGWPASRKPSLRDLIETPDARRAFFKNSNIMFCLNHRHLPAPLLI